MAKPLTRYSRSIRVAQMRLEMVDSLCWNSSAIWSVITLSFQPHASIIDYPQKYPLKNNLIRFF